MPADTAASVALHDLPSLAAAVTARTDILWLRDWADEIACCACPRTHLAVMTGPYLQRLIDGEKTIESRFCRHRVAPYGQLTPGDVIFFKPAAAPICAAAIAGQVQHLDLRETPIQWLRTWFGDAIAPEGDVLWRQRANARYATLVEITRLTLIPDVPIAKHDRRGWVVLSEGALPARRSSE